MRMRREIMRSEGDDSSQTSREKEMEAKIANEKNQASKSSISLLRCIKEFTVSYFINDSIKH